MGHADASLRNLPRVDEIIAHPAVGVADAPRAVVREAARQAVEEARAALLGGAEGLAVEAIAARAGEIVRGRNAMGLRRAINASGVILHTGLGRTPLSAAAQAALAEVAAGYSSLQIDLASGKRSQREAQLAWLFKEIVGAASVLVVNNNAAATVLVLNALAAGREVIVSRGEMVEIGGAFRIPEIMALAGCRLVEVGCTNRTHLRDYEAAITPETALILAVHQSNYRIQGFASQTPVGDLAELAHARGLACAHDLGSGALLDLRRWGLPHEPSVPESLAAGADVVLFSGDKLLGGPQCGIILGRADLLETMRRDPFYRTFRVDKLTLAALEATLRLFLEPESLPQRHRLVAVLTQPLDVIRARAQGLARSIAAACSGWLAAETRDGESEIGGGSLAGHSLPTLAVRLCPKQCAAEELARQLRIGEPPIIARVHEDAVWLDLRTILPDEDELVVAALQRVGAPPVATDSGHAK